MRDHEVPLGEDVLDLDPQVWECHPRVLDEAPEAVDAVGDARVVLDVLRAD
jgi:hypothetical protein